MDNTKMNMILLTFGIVIIIISIVLITINLGSIDENHEKFQNKESTFELPRNIEIENIKRYYDEKNYSMSQSDLNKTKEISKEVEVELDNKNDDIEEIQDKISYKKNNDFYEEDSSMDRNLDVTDEILEMYKQGINISEIAKKFHKGFREVETILKVNNNFK